jgi:uncharacterized SAM-binding protein YcdF (DUF218 family)
MDTLFFVTAKLVSALIRVDTWIVLILALIVLALVLERRRLAMLLSAGALAVLLTLSLLPLGDLLLQPLEASYPVNPALSRVDGIIVLGGGEAARISEFWGQPQLNDGGDRYTAALALARQFPDAQLLFTGGSGALRDLADGGSVEAEMAGAFFLDQGVASGRLLLEGKSRNTAENARLSRALAAPGPDDVWVLVTSASHMPRAMRSFVAAGWAGLVAYPVDYRTASFRDGVVWDLVGHLEVLNAAIKAQVGQLAYRLTGR